MVGSLKLSASLSLLAYVAGAAAFFSRARRKLA
jgi:hypothetical protein